MPIRKSKDRCDAYLSPSGQQNSLAMPAGSKILRHDVPTFCCSGLQSGRIRSYPRQRSISMEIIGVHYSICCSKATEILYPSFAPLLLLLILLLLQLILFILLSCFSCLLLPVVPPGPPPPPPFQLFPLLPFFLSSLPCSHSPHLSFPFLCICRLLIVNSWHYFEARLLAISQSAAMHALLLPLFLPAYVFLKQLIS